MSGVTIEVLSTVLAGPNYPMRVLVTERDGPNIAKYVKYIYPQVGSTWTPKNCNVDWRHKNYPIQNELPPFPPTVLNLVWHCYYCGKGPYSMQYDTHCVDVFCGKLRHPDSKVVDHSWKAADLITLPNGQPTLTNFRSEQPPHVLIPCHQLMVNIVDVTKYPGLSELQPHSFHSDSLLVVTHPAIGQGNTPVVIKLAPSTLDRACLENIAIETQAYHALNGTGLTPQFLGHVIENGRIVGFILEYIASGHAPESPAEIQACLLALDKLHQCGWLHGDAHKKNFIVQANGTVVIIDFEFSKQSNNKIEFAMDKENMLKNSSSM